MLLLLSIWNTLADSGGKFNPECVSTDYDEADRLYFENITLETVTDIYRLESSSGVIVSVGGQTPNNIAVDLHRLNVKVLGTSPEMIDRAENRYNFSRILDTILVDQPEWKNLTSIEDAYSFCDGKYPVLVRPSYVLSGAAMNTVYSRKDLASYLQQASDVSKDYPVVITKYIEGAKEIEMDAVAKDGKMLCHFISEHVENAGVHSGDATLILPPQDLDAETVARIEDATRKIGNAFNVTGPYNIQFIAKNKEIKVIECNIRASRSFPFVSKVMGVDLIEMATKAMAGIPVTAYPPINIPSDFVGVKVPQFSFSRLSGADPVLGVEMASTGEVACFGRDKYEAYIKALMSTGFRLPKKNVLFSIGSYEHKLEMLPSIQKLHQLGFNLFATPGTADFLEENGVPVKYLEVLGATDEKQSSEYSLTHHLATNLIDLYVNLPSSNRFRRPASYMSKGYMTRRMAVDYQTPLVTNVKIAKILIEGISRHYDLEIGKNDCQTSHQTVTLPGLINVSGFLPNLASIGSKGMEAMTRASIMAGFSMVRIMPLGTDSAITDASGLRIAQQNSRRGGGARCDFNLSIAATSANADQVGLLADEVGSLWMPFNQLSGNISKVAAVTAHFAAWPNFKPIITDAKTTDLASILLLASLHDRKIHVTSVTTKDDINLIALSKSKGLAVTCDVSVYALFLSQADFPSCSALPTSADQLSLWENLETIDVFSVGTLPHQIAQAAGQQATPDAGIMDTLPLLFTAVSEGRLTVQDIVARLHDNPMAIFDLHDQEGCVVEVEFDRILEEAPTATWTPFQRKIRRAAVQRVTFKGAAASLDGEFSNSCPSGRDMSSHLPQHVQDSQMAASKIMSPRMQPRVDSPSYRRSSVIDIPSRAKSARALSSSNHDPGTERFSRLPASPLTDSFSFQPMERVIRPGQPGLGPSAIPEEYEAPLSSLPPPLPFLSNSVTDLLAHSPFKQKHIISVEQFSKADLHLLFTVAQDMRVAVSRHGILDILRGRLLCTLFFEPSTRTSASFDAAMQRLGGRTIAISTAHSSTMKGESLQDTIRTLACYGDGIVLRHPDNDSADVAAKYSPVPIINGGNGTREHPTQAFLDLFTIREELGTLNGLTVTFVGDLRHGRTVHSLCRLLARYNASVQLVAPASLRLPADVRQGVLAAGQLLSESEQLTPEILARSDVLYCTRVQKERFDSPEAYEAVKDVFCVDAKVLRQCKKSAIVMHPLPRNAEISEEIDGDQRAAYFRQMRYGLFCRMALLALVLAQ